MNHHEIDPEWSGASYSKPPVCNRCGSRDVYWQEVYGADGAQSWALFNDSNHRRHLCQSAPSADGFTNEEETT